MDVFNRLGELALGSRLRRLSDQIMQQGLLIYQDRRIDFDPKWFPVFFVLSEEGSLGITEIAQRLGVTHPGVIKIAKELEQKGYLESVQDKEDRRRRVLSISEKGRMLLPELKATWDDIATCFSQLLQQQEHHLLAGITEIERNFQEKPLYKRVRNHRNERLLESVHIHDYRPEWGSYFKAYNYSWIEHYFSVEPIDIEVLENHQEKIIDTGGAILFAQIGTDIVGTCALKKAEPGVYELTKMAVTESAQGKQVGKKLGLAILERARNLGAQKVFLDSNRRLTPALQLYRRLGFIEVNYTTTGESEYQRSDIRMEIKFPVVV